MVNCVFSIFIYIFNLFCDISIFSPTPYYFSIFGSLGIFLLFLWILSQFFCKVCRIMRKVVIYCIKFYFFVLYSILRQKKRRSSLLFYILIVLVKHICSLLMLYFILYPKSSIFFNNSILSLEYTNLGFALSIIIFS